MKNIFKIMTKIIPGDEIDPHLVFTTHFFCKLILDFHGIIVQLSFIIYIHENLVQI